MRQYRVYLESSQWTCFSNFVLISKIYQYLTRNGHKVTDEVSEADFIIINSCGHTQTAEDITIGHYRRYYKQKKPGAKIIITGCLVNINPNKLESLDVDLIQFKNLEDFDNIFFRNVKFKDVADKCDLETKEKIVHKKQIYSYKSTLLFYYPKILNLSKKIKNNYEHLADQLDAKNKIFIKIGSGCIGNCSYCAIKKAKGKPVSRSTEAILNDIEKTYDPSKGIYLVADDCGSYGVDTGTNLIELLYAINKKFRNIKINLEFLEPIWLRKHPEKYIKVFNDLNIKFVQIPLQSGSDKIVKDMNRRYKVKDIICTINKIKKCSPKTIITTYFIVGFPGESFNDLFKTIKASRHFDAVLLMQFSERKGTACENFSNKKSKLEILFRYLVAVILTKPFYINKLVKNKYK